ncbi:MAG: hypothetical protein ACJAUP_001016 [Cellvibrionaceae bacterium]
MKKNHLSLYLKNYAEAKAVSIGNDIPKHLLFQHTIIFPAYNENSDFLERLKKSALSQASLLVIVIINQPDTIEASTYNKNLWENSIKRGEEISSKEDYHLLHWSNTQSHLLIVDCFSENRCLPAKQGVGLARKIGCDIASTLIEKRILTTQWIHTSDADTYLPDDYLSKMPTHNDFSAAIYSFKHIFDESTSEDFTIVDATLLYEKALNYYVDGLSYAGSPYAHHSLGSCIAINTEAYAQARGFPKRAGAEDFYLLNKLRKLGPIKTLSNKPLLITARLSNRVPFGTGPAIKKIIEDESRLDNYKYYSPELFAHLKTVLIHFNSLFSNKSTPNNWLKKLPQIERDGLIDTGIRSLFSHIQSHANSHNQCLKQTHDWFDAFKTLKFIHFLDKKYDRVLLGNASEQLLRMSR